MHDNSLSISIGLVSYINIVPQVSTLLFTYYIQGSILCVEHAPQGFVDEGLLNNSFIWLCFS